MQERKNLCSKGKKTGKIRKKNIDFVLINASLHWRLKGFGCEHRLFDTESS